MVRLPSVPTMPMKQKDCGGRTRTRLVTALSLGAALLVVGNAMSEWSPLLGLPTPAAVPVPGDAALQVALGRRLFMEPQLAEDGVVACANCHIPEHGFTVNGIPTASGRGGRILRRNAPTVLNAAIPTTQFVDGRIATLEEQIWGPLLSVEEAWNPSAEAVVSRLRGRADYDAEFRAAFAGQRPSRDLIGAAIAAYERSLAAAGSSFDRWYFGRDPDALSAEARAGFAVFRDSGCARCHTISGEHATFTDNTFHNTGVEWARLNGSLGIRKVIADLGRYEVTGAERDRRSFRVPSLRNVALTHPYMHDGSLATLRDVVDWYDGGGSNDPVQDPGLTPLHLSESQKRQLLSFLNSLTSDNAEVLAREARLAAQRR